MGRQALYVEVDETGKFIRFNLGDGSNAISAIDLQRVLDIEPYAGGTSGWDDSAIAQEQRDDLHAKYGRRGCVVKVSSHAYSVLSGQTLRQGISYISDEIYTPFSEGTSEASGPRFVLPDTCSVPMFINDRRAYPDVYNRGSSGSEDGSQQVYACNGFAGINFIGSLDVTKHTMDADLIRLLRAWNVEIYGCSFYTSRGFGVRALDCNVLRVINNQFTNSGLFAPSLADSRIFDNDIFNGGGCASAMWIAGSAASAHKNIVRGNLSGNNGSNGYVTHPLRQFQPDLLITNVNTVTGEITLGEYPQFAALALGHCWSDGTPLCFTIRRTWASTGGEPAKSGVMPTGFNESYTYYAKVTGTNKLKLARGRAELAAGTYIIPSDAGAGSVYLNCGKQAAIFVNDGATGISFESGRVDQAFGASVLFDGATGNSWTAGLIQEGSYGNNIADTTEGALVYEPVIEQPAFQLINGATGNKVAMVIEGTKQGTYNGHGRESRQKWGVFIDASSENSSSFKGSNVYNHNVATSSAGAADYYDDRYNDDVLWMHVEDFYPVSGTTLPAIQPEGGGREDGWRHSNGIDSSVGGQLVIPFGWKHVDVYVYWVNMAAGAGNVVWHVDINAYDVGTTINAVDIATSDTAGAAGAQDILCVTQLTQLTWTGMTGKRSRVRVKRTGTSGSDTLANNAGFLGLKLVRRF